MSCLLYVSTSPSQFFLYLLLHLAMTRILIQIQILIGQHISIDCTTKLLEQQILIDPTTCSYHLKLSHIADLITNFKNFQN